MILKLLVADRYYWRFLIDDNGMLLAYLYVSFEYRNNIVQVRKTCLNEDQIMDQKSVSVCMIMHTDTDRTDK